MNALVKDTNEEWYINNLIWSSISIFQRVSKLSLFIHILALKSCKGIDLYDPSKCKDLCWKRYQKFKKKSCSWLRAALPVLGQWLNSKPKLPDPSKCKDLCWKRNQKFKKKIVLGWEQLYLFGTMTKFKAYFDINY